MWQLNVNPAKIIYLGIIPMRQTHYSCRRQAHTQPFDILGSLVFHFPVNSQMRSLIRPSCLSLGMCMCMCRCFFNLFMVICCITAVLYDGLVPRWTHQSSMQIIADKVEISPPM